jgi:catechol 2,3-dioxygenase-like lactoylglutathione lyase family enzyme
VAAPDLPLLSGQVITLHHAHLMASDIDATIAFWRDGFGAQVAADVDFAGARNVFLRLGSGRIHLYDQPPKSAGQATVHHLGVQTDKLEAVVERLRGLGVSVTDIRREPAAAYAMAQGPDRLLVEIFQPDMAAMPPGLREYFDGA